MKRFIALMVAVGMCSAFGLGCTKMTKEEPKKDAPAVEKMMTPPPPPPPPPAAPATPPPAGN